MSVGGSFFSSLIGSYADAMRTKHTEERKRQDDAIDKQIDIIKLAVSTGQADVGAAAERIDELNKQRGIKSKFSFRNLIGQFGDISGTTAGADTGAGAGPPGRGGRTAGQPLATTTPSEQATLTEGERPAATPPIPQRGKVFFSPEELTERRIAEQKRVSEEITLPETRELHRERMEEIQATYGGRVARSRTGVLGSSLPMKTDAAGNPIDPNKTYSVDEDYQGRAIQAYVEGARPGVGRMTGPEAQVMSLAKDIAANHNLDYDTLPPEQQKHFELEARKEVYSHRQAQALYDLERFEGLKLSNQVKRAAASGKWTPGLVTQLYRYVASEALRRIEYDPDSMELYGREGLQGVEDHILYELTFDPATGNGLTRADLAQYLRGVPGAPGTTPKTRTGAENPLGFTPSKPPTAPAGPPARP